MTVALVTIDVGNTRIKFGFFKQPLETSERLPVCRQFLAVSVSDQIPWTEITGWAADQKAASVTSIIAGANQRGIEKVIDTWPTDQWPLPVQVSNPDHLPLEVELPEPSKVGIDRLLHAVAANIVRPAGQQTIVVASGTATTVDVISTEGRFRGGAILPGLEISARALHRYTELLPLLPIDELAAQDLEALGRNTIEALKSGLVWGQLGAVRELVTQFERLDERESLVLLTGGAAPILAAHLSNARHEPYLSLQGMALVSDHLADTQQQAGR